MALMRNIFFFFCQWWLLGVRNEAHDNLPSWVPLVPHCYGNGTFLWGWLLPSLYLLFLSSPPHVCVEFPAKYIMVSNSGLYCLMQMQQYIAEQKGTMEYSLLHFGVGPFIVLHSSSNSELWRSRMEQMNCHEKLIWLPWCLAPHFSKWRGMKEVTHQ